MKTHNLIRIAAALSAAAIAGCNDYNFTQPDPPAFEVTPAFTGILEGSSVQLEATSGGQPVAVTWASDDPNVLTVNANGVAFGVGGGITAAIATLTSDPSQKRSASITVTAPPALTSGTGVAISSSGARFSTILYKIVVPAGKTNLKITVSGGTGDVDIFIRQGLPPDLDEGEYDDSSEKGGNDEVINVANPVAGTYYVALMVWDPYAGATLTATLTP